MPEGDAWPRHLRLAGRPLEPAEVEAGELALAGRAGRACVRPGPAGPARRPDHPGRSGRGQDHLSRSIWRCNWPWPRRAPGHRRAAAAAGLAGRLRQRVSDDANLRLDSFIAAADPSGPLVRPAHGRDGGRRGRRVAGRCCCWMAWTKVRQAGLRHRVVGGAGLLHRATAARQQVRAHQPHSGGLSGGATHPPGRPGPAQPAGTSTTRRSRPSWSAGTATLERQAGGDTAISAADACAVSRDESAHPPSSATRPRAAGRQSSAADHAGHDEAPGGGPAGAPGATLHHQAVETLISSWNRAPSLSRQAPLRGAGCHSHGQRAGPVGPLDPPGEPLRRAGFRVGAAPAVGGHLLPAGPG